MNKTKAYFSAKLTELRNEIIEELNSFTFPENCVLKLKETIVLAETGDGDVVVEGLVSFNDETKVFINSCDGSDFYELEFHYFKIEDLINILDSISTTGFSIEPIEPIDEVED